MVWLCDRDDVTGRVRIRTALGRRHRSAEAKREGRWRW